MKIKREKWTLKFLMHAGLLYDNNSTTAAVLNDMMKYNPSPKISFITTSYSTSARTVNGCRFQ